MLKDSLALSGHVYSLWREYQLLTRLTHTQIWIHAELYNDAYREGFAC